jgi:hypothetical protein
MLSYDPVFAELLQLSELLAVVDNTVSETAITHHRPTEEEHYRAHRR